MYLLLAYNFVIYFQFCDNLKFGFYNHLFLKNRNFEFVDPIKIRVSQFVERLILHLWCSSFAFYFKDVDSRSFGTSEFLHKMAKSGLAKRLSSETNSGRFFVKTRWKTLN